MSEAVVAPVGPVLRGKATVGAFAMLAIVALRSGSSRLVAASSCCGRSGAHIRGSGPDGYVRIKNRIGNQETAVNRAKLLASHLEMFDCISGNASYRDLSCYLLLSDQRDRAFESFCSISLFPGSSSRAR